MIAWLYGISVVLMILLPVLLAAGLRRIAQPAWILFGVGCLTFTLSQVVHIPLNNWLGSIGLIPGTSSSGLKLWQTAIMLGLTAGLCEELMRAAGYAVIQKLKPGWMRLSDAVMVGLGHGGIESMVFGGVLTAASAGALLPLIGVDLSTLGLKPDQLAALRSQLNLLTATPWIGAVPLLERIIAISAHVIFSLMVWRAFTARGAARWIYLPLAVLYHALIDCAAVLGMHYWGDKLILFELAFIGMLIPGYLWVYLQIRRAAKTEPAAPAAAKGSLAGEWAVFAVVLKKEIIQQWKTRRLLVLGAVFLFFGMGSPLISKLTPELLKSLQGGDLIAKLLPQPSAADAMNQYAKNLFQFGFVLAILLAMGAVVGEKESRVAPMILSKPMPRWAFIAGKFAAQGLMYLGAFTLAGIGAYYYTLILFGPLDPGRFVLMNLLLLMWTLPFVALSLLGSVLGKTTASAGGIAVALCIGLALAGSIPAYGALLPGALLGWATQAGQAAAGVQPAAVNFATATLAQLPVNGGALASAIVVIVLSLVLAIGFFEQQEL